MTERDSTPTSPPAHDRLQARPYGVRQSVSWKGGVFALDYVESFH